MHPTPDPSENHHDPDRLQPADTSPYSSDNLLSPLPPLSKGHLPSGNKAAPAHQPEQLTRAVDYVLGLRNESHDPPPIVWVTAEKELCVQIVRGDALYQLPLRGSPRDIFDRNEDKALSTLYSFYTGTKHSLEKSERELIFDAIHRYLARAHALVRIGEGADWVLHWQQHREDLQLVNSVLKSVASIKLDHFEQTEVASLLLSSRLVGLQGQTLDHRASGNLVHAIVLLSEDMRQAADALGRTHIDSIAADEFWTRQHAALREQNSNQVSLPLWEWLRGWFAEASSSPTSQHQSLNSALPLFQPESHSVSEYTPEGTIVSGSDGSEYLWIRIPGGIRLVSTEPDLSNTVAGLYDKRFTSPHIEVNKSMREWLSIAAVHRDRMQLFLNFGYFSLAQQDFSAAWSHLEQGLRFVFVPAAERKGLQYLESAASDEYLCDVAEHFFSLVTLQANAHAEHLLNRNQALRAIECFTDAQTDCARLLTTLAGASLPVHITETLLAIREKTVAALEDQAEQLVTKLDPTHPRRIAFELQRALTHEDFERAIELKRLRDAP